MIQKHLNQIRLTKEPNDEDLIKVRTYLHLRKVFFFSADKSKINKITPNVFSSWMIHLWKLQVRRHVYLSFCHYFPNLNFVFIISWHKVGGDELTTSSKASPQLSDFTFEVVLYMYFQNPGNRYLLSIHILTRKKN